jgi:hypothetical protein
MKIKLPDGFIPDGFTPDPSSAPSVTVLPPASNPLETIRQILPNSGITSSTIASDIATRLTERNTRLPGPLAFLLRLGEQQRAKLADAQANHATSLLRLEEAYQQAKLAELRGQTSELDYIRNKVLEVQRAEMSYRTAEQQMEAIEIQTKLTREAGARGYSFATDEEVRKKEAEITQELRKIEETARITFEYRQKEILAEVEGTIRLASTDELVRQHKVHCLIDYGRKVETATSDFERQVYSKEIERLKKELDGDQGRMAGQEDAK